MDDIFGISFGIWIRPEIIEADGALLPEFAKAGGPPPPGRVLLDPYKTFLTNIRKPVAFEVKVIPSNKLLTIEKKLLNFGKSFNFPKSVFLG